MTRNGRLAKQEKARDGDQVGWRSGVGTSAGDQAQNSCLPVFDPMAMQLD